MASFAKYVGGCPTNIAVGTARLGLRSALITRVGDEHMGRFIKEQCAREGVDVRGVVTDPQRLTALVILGIRDKDTFPLIFYRENCADAALSEADIDEDLIASAKAVVVTGTHFSTATLDAASRKAMRLAKAHGGKVVLDIDYRPVLWGLTGHGLGEERFVANDEVSAHLQTILPECDLDRRHRGGDPHRRRQHRHHGGDPRRARGGTRGPDRGQARADGLHGLSRPDPGHHRRGRLRARASRSRCSTCWAPATPS